jgi:uncharacterized protein with FMN-binding domain
MSTLTVLVLLFGYHTSTSSRPASDRGVLAAPAEDGSAAGTDGSGTGSGTGGSGGGSGTTGGSAPSATTGGSAPSGTTGGSTTASGQPVTVTGDSADTRWGPVQVRLTVASRRITKVTLADYPQNNRRDEEINARALPILVQETLRAQSAEIDMVSGATVTSEGYVESLQSALDKAGL